MFALRDGIKSIYGGNSQGSVSITGSGSGSESGSGSGYMGCPEIIPITDSTDTLALNELLALIDNLYDIIETSFPSANAMASFIPEFTVPARLNPFTYVRFAWIKANPGMKLYPSIEAALTIKDLYLANGLDWTQDPLILTYLGSS
jgi:hypothetical protein